MLLISLNDFIINLLSNSLFIWLTISQINQRQDTTDIALSSTRLWAAVFSSQLSALYCAIPGVNYLLAIMVSSYLLNLYSTMRYRQSILVALLSNTGSLALLSLIRLVF